MKHKTARQKAIIKTSLISILTNLVLVAFKLAVGLLATSNAIIVDAINNLTDTLSAIITIIGTKLASRRPDREHPHGHGRYEYLTALIVGGVIFAAGLFALTESIPKIFHPELPDYSIVSIVVVVAAVIIKILLGLYVRAVGRAQDSVSLVASGLDAMFDAALSFSTLLGIFSAMFFQFSLDGILGVLIALFILRTSLSILADSAVNITSGRTDPELYRKLYEFVRSFPEVIGAYDLVLHDYGPGAYIGTIHIQVPDRLTVKDIHRLTTEIADRSLAKFGITLTVGIYAANRQTKPHQAMQQHLEAIVARFRPAVIQAHGFYIDDQQKLVSFDLVVDYFYRDKLKLKNRIVREFRRAYPEYHCHVTLDLDAGREPITPPEN